MLRTLLFLGVTMLGTLVSLSGRAGLESEQIYHALNASDALLVDGTVTRYQKSVGGLLCQLSIDMGVLDPLSGTTYSCYATLDGDHYDPQAIYRALNVTEQAGPAGVRKSVGGLSCRVATVNPPLYQCETTRASLEFTPQPKPAK